MSGTLFLEGGCYYCKCDPAKHALQKHNYYGNTQIGVVIKGLLIVTLFFNKIQVFAESFFGHNNRDGANDHYYNAGDLGGLDKGKTGLESFK